MEPERQIILVDKPTTRQVRTFANRYVHNGKLLSDWGSGLRWYEKLRDFLLPPEPDSRDAFRMQVIEQAMGVGGRLLLAGERTKTFKTFYPVGFLSYLVGNSSRLGEEFVQYSEQVREQRLKNKGSFGLAFTRGRMEDILLGGSREDPIASPEDLRKIYPYNDNTGERPIVYIETIEVDATYRNRRIGTRLLMELIKRENPEIIEALAVPASLSFWDKKGFSILPLYQKRLTAVAWKTPGSQKVDLDSVTRAPKGDSTEGQRISHC